MKRRLILFTFLFTLFNHLFAQNKLFVDFTTGDDNLQIMEFQENPELKIILNGKPEIVIKNINQGKEWPNNSVRRVIVPLGDDITLDDLKEIQIARTSLAGRKYVWDYLKKDNWTLKNLKVTGIFYRDGKKKVYDNLFKNLYRGQVYRFVYEGGDGNKEGQLFTGILGVEKIPVSTEPASNNLVAVMTFRTGNDDLRGGNDNVDVLLYRSTDPGVITLENVNKSIGWGRGYVATVTREIPNSAMIDIRKFDRVVVRHTGGGPGGTNNDNWDLTQFKMVLKSNIGEDKAPVDFVKEKILVNSVSGLIHRFTGEAREKSFSVFLSGGQEAINNISFTAVFGTGGDNLEGGNSNNVSLRLHFSNTDKTLTVNNLNNKAKWENFTTHTITKREIFKSYSFNIDDISAVELIHTGGRDGLFVDNWDLDKFKLTVYQNDKSLVVVDQVAAPIVRFTGNLRVKKFIVSH